MSIQVLRSGVLTTLQDLGRVGLQHFGVPVSGAMDEYAHRVANILVGNSEDQAVLEVTLQGPSLLFETDQLIAITGADMEPRIAGALVPSARPVLVRAGSRIDFGARKTGCRSYVSVAGGFAVAPVMGSRSTYLRGRFGGLEGRPLKKGDRLVTGPLQSSNRFPSLASAMTAGGHAFAATDSPLLTVQPSPTASTLRVTPGTQWEWFEADGQSRFLSSSFEIDLQSDRMGYRLKGPPIELPRPREMLSEAVSFGTIQVPPDGNPIVLMADRQTTGGYPKIAQVASVDLPILAQMLPGMRVDFAAIDPTESQRLFLERARTLDDLKDRVACVAAQCQS